MNYHPPIPPNDPRFREDHDGDDFYWLETPTPVWCCGDDGGEYCDGIIIRDCENGWRAIIAAVARCAWLEEARKIIARWPNPDDRMDDDDYDDIERANRNAEAWRAWGEQK